MTSASPFFDDPVLKVLDATIQKSWDVPPSFPSLLQGQENYVTQAQAIELAKIARATHAKAAKELIDLYKHKLQLIDKEISVVQLRDQLRSNLDKDFMVNDLLENLKSMRMKIRSGELGFLQMSAPSAHVDTAPVVEKALAAPSDEPIQAHLETSAQPQASAPKVAALFHKQPAHPGAIPERPKFTSSAGLAYVAEKKAQESATKQRRDAFHSALRQKQHFTPIDEVPSQKVMNEVAHSGGSNLDGSYIENGTTYEDIVGVRNSISPFGVKYSQPNFDETGLEDLDQCIIPEAPCDENSKENTSLVPPPFTPVSRKFDLGPFMFESSRLSNILPSRPNLSCSVGKKWLNDKK